MLDMNVMSPAWEHELLIRLAALVRRACTRVTTRVDVLSHRMRRPVWRKAGIPRQRHEHPREVVGEEVGVGVGVGVVECQHNGRAFAHDPKGRGFESRPVRFQ